MSIILGVFEEGLVYAIMALGVYITYKILDFPDLSVDGTFPLGGAVTVTLRLPIVLKVRRICGRRPGRMRDGVHSRKIKGPGPAVRYHCHDRPLLRQLKSCG